MNDPTTRRGDDGSASEPPDAEPMTATQATYLRQLSELARVPFESHLSQAEAAERIEALQRQTGRKPQEILYGDQTDG